MAVYIPDEYVAVARACRHPANITAKRHSGPVTANLKVIATARDKQPILDASTSSRLPPNEPKCLNNLIHAKIKQFDCVVADAAQQVFAVLGQVEGGDLPLQDDFVGRAVGSRVPEADLLVVVAADDGGAGDVGAGGDEIVAAGAGELRLDARPAPQVPDLQGAVVAAGDHFRRLAEELRRHDLAAVPSQCVLERRKRNASVKVFESGKPPPIDSLVCTEPCERIERSMSRLIGAKFDFLPPMAGQSRGAHQIHSIIR